MMYAPLITAFVIILIVLEAFTDGFEYIGWTTHKKPYGYLKHISQVVLILVSFIFGNYYTDVLWRWHTLYFLSGWILLHYDLFDLFYIQISDNRTQGRTSIFDWITGKLPFLNNTILRLITAFIGCILILK